MKISTTNVHHNLIKANNIVVFLLTITNPAVGEAPNHSPIIVGAS